MPCTRTTGFGPAGAARDAADAWTAGDALAAGTASKGMARAVTAAALIVRTVRIQNSFELVRQPTPSWRSCGETAEAWQPLPRLDARTSDEVCRIAKITRLDNELLSVHRPRHGFPAPELCSARPRSRD